jgi:hypothetical protein
MIPFTLNHKQRDLIDQLFREVQQRFPEITLKSYAVNPDDKEHIWIIVDAPMTEEREIELGRYAAGISTDILMDYGYAISIMSDNSFVHVSN